SSRTARYGYPKLSSRSSADVTSCRNSRCGLADREYPCWPTSKEARMAIHPGLPKLIATDLDGTLVRSDETVSAYSHEVLERVKAGGLPLVGATGRGPRLIDSCLEFIPAADFLVLAQGARVVDLRDPAGPVTLRAVTVPGTEILGVLD